MAPPPSPSGAAEKAAEPAPPDGQRSLPTPFLTKTYQLVDDPSVDDMISWNEDGSTFVVWRPAEFARDLLPKYFKHNNFSSFVRQLNTYGFRKIVPDRWEFANDCFRRGEKRLLCDIHRRKITQAAPAAVSVPVNRNSSPGPPPSAAAGSSSSVELTEENERLRKENTRLSRELAQMKSLCSHISVLISKYADEGGGGRAAEAPPPPSTVLELMPARGKRAREEDKVEAPTPEVKSEPSDPASDTKEDISPERHQRPWVVYCPRPVRRACQGPEAGVGDRDGALT
ncbi:Heat stress transcription factor [Musa troglodytarum]|uniref:Heat stress transcription factor n=1 Tax=Musa troglodytarum TaxID=320322 RepID=A0A9E7JYX4_9LILI|nr:Heat stress transcription factor [Musa troglodytarum]